jgi:uncharacterized membrane protein
LEITNKEKWLSTVTYLSLGIGGFILLLLRQAESRFIKFHVFQSILLGLLYMFLTQCFGILISILDSVVGLIPGFKSTGGVYIMFLHNITQQALFIGLICVISYCLFHVWKNQLAQIKWVSEQINKML